MKKLITAILLIMSFGSTYGQSDDELPEKGLPEKDGKVFIEQVVILKDSTTKKERIFLVVKDWVSKTFRSSKGVIDYEDKQEGKIVCKGNTKNSFNSTLGSRDEIKVDFTMDFTIKDGKFRLQLYNLQPILNNYSFMGSSNQFLTDMKIEIDGMNNKYNSKTEKNKRERKYNGKQIVKIASMIKPIFDDAIDYITKNSIINKSNDF